MDYMNNRETQVKNRKKLIEVAIPLDVINAASAREESVHHGHPGTFHSWWTRRPMALARAVVFSQMVDDPSEHPELFPTGVEQDKERQRLFRLIEELVRWENKANKNVLQQASDEIWKSWRSTCGDNKDHPRAAELFDPEKLPAFYDPFCGGGSLPLEAQKLGLEAYASDLNPVAVLVTKAMIEIPPKFAGQPPVNPALREDSTASKKGQDGTQGLVEDVLYYGQQMRDEVEKRVGYLYPKIEVTSEMTSERPDLKHYVGQKLTVVAWLWTRTVKSPDPAFSHVGVPLASTFMLSTKKGKEAYVQPVIENGGYRFAVKLGKPKDKEAVKTGTKLSRGAHFKCIMSDTPITDDHIKAEGTAGRMDARLMAIVAEGDRGLVYLDPTPEHESAARNAKPEWKPETPIANDPQVFWTPPYGLTTYGDLFTDRQLITLTTFSDMVQETREQVRSDAVAAGMADDGIGIDSSGTGASAYAEAVGVYLALAIDAGANMWSSLCCWLNDQGAIQETFAKGMLPMVWDFAESNPLSSSEGNFGHFLEKVAVAVATVPADSYGNATFGDAAVQRKSEGKFVSTDPPNYNNIGYADLSDFSYVWLRRSLQPVFHNLFAAPAVPKTEEIIAAPHRHSDKTGAEAFFLDGMTQAMHRLAEQSHSAFPVTIYYSSEQLDATVGVGTVNTGWETFITAVNVAGFAINGTWPMQTERTTELSGKIKALTSSILLVCRKRDIDAPGTTRQDFVALLRDEMPKAVTKLQGSNVASVDLAQAVIGLGMAIYTRYARVMDASGQVMSVREALSLINQTMDEVLSV